MLIFPSRFPKIANHQSERTRKKSRTSGCMIFSFSSPRVLNSNFAGRLNSWSRSAERYKEEDYPSECSSSRIPCFLSVPSLGRTLWISCRSTSWSIGERKRRNPVDDSILRGTSSNLTVKNLQKDGCHMRSFVHVSTSWDATYLFYQWWWHLYWHAKELSRTIEPIHTMIICTIITTKPNYS